MDFEIPKFPLADLTDQGVDFLKDNLQFITKAISRVTEDGIEAIVDLLMYVHPAIFIIAVGALAWKLAGRNVMIFVVLGFAFLWNLRLWEPTMETLTLVIFATALAVIIALPIGILAAISQPMFRITMPILDFMQTMPPFVYLIPALGFFGLGSVAAIFATVIFAMPPAIRLTSLGIRQIPSDLVEAADAFGSTGWQKLTKLQLPLAIPTIMAGINQTIMLSLSMVVIAAMIGAGGLGSEVWRAIQRLETGDGFEAGIAIVILAMVLDRITQRIAKKGEA